MSDRGDALAQRLLDAQVQWVLAELTGDRLAANIARDVDDILTIAATLVVGDVVEAELVKATAHRLVRRTSGSPVVADLVGALSEAIYDLGAAERHTLGAVVDRESVEALVAKILGMHDTQDRVLERLADSPLVASVASTFVTRIVGDFLAQNRERAERVPGMASLLSFGTNAASRMRGTADRHLDQVLGDAAGRSTQFALRRTNTAVREMLHDAPVEGAVMQVWDLHAVRPISDLREYLSRQDLRELSLLVHRIVVGASGTAYADDLLDACIDVFFDHYGKHSVVDLLDELSIGRADIVEEVRAYAPAIVEAAKADGRLAEFVRTRLSPFFESPDVRAMLA